MKWFYIDESVTDGDRRKGPFSLDEIREFASTGIISEETLVWHNGQEQWIPWKDTPESLDSSTRDELLQSTIEALLREQERLTHYAGFFVRTAAFIVDNLLLSIVGGIILLIMSSLQWMDLAQIQDLFATYVSNPTNGDAMGKILEAPGMSTFISIWSVLQAVYFISFNAIWSATPGKMLFKLCIISNQGARLTWGLALLRYLASIFTQFTMVIYGLGYLIVCIDPKRRALHDWVARTYVIYNESLKDSENQSDHESDSEEN